MPMVAAPGCLDVGTRCGPKWLDANGGDPHGCLKFGILGGPIWLDADGGGPRAVLLLALLVVQLG